MKNSNFTIGNQTRNLPACSVVPQPTGPSRAPFKLVLHDYISVAKNICHFVYVDASIHCDIIYVSLCMLFLMFQFLFFCCYSFI